MLRTAPLGLAALLWLSTLAHAQTVVLDQGTFRLSIGGREVGRDSFNIRRTGEGEDARILALGWVDLEGRRSTSRVETTGGYAFVAYQAVVSGADTAEIRVAPRMGRFEVTLVSPTGEQTREMRARDGAVILDGNVGHQYYFLAALAREGAVLQAIVPGVNDPGRVEVQSITRETLTLGGQAIEARRVGVTVDGVERRLWVDAQGRVLRVEIPSQGFLAERLRAPA